MAQVTVQYPSLAMSRSRSPRIQLRHSSVCEECNEEVTDNKYFVINNRKRHWNCAEMILKEIERMEEAIDNKKAKEKNRQNCFLIARMDVCMRHGSDFVCSFEMVGYKEEMHKYYQSLLDITVSVSEMNVDREAKQWVILKIRSERDRLQKLLE